MSIQFLDKTYALSAVSASMTDVVLDSMKGSELVSLHNLIAENIEAKTVKRFSDHATAIKRTWAILEQYQEWAQAEDPEPVQAPKAPAKTRSSKGVNIQPKERIFPCRQGSKQSILVDMLSRPSGATMEQLQTALGKKGKPWTEATVRSGFYWDMNSIKGYGISTEFKNGVAHYHLVMPEGMEAPLAHSPVKSHQK